MYSTGIDHHKKFSVLVTMDEKGKIIKRGRVNGHDREELAGYFKSLKGKSRVVHEAGWNWDCRCQFPLWACLCDFDFKNDLCICS